MNENFNLNEHLWSSIEPELTSPPQKGIKSFLQKHRLISLSMIVTVLFLPLFTIIKVMSLETTAYELLKQLL